MNKEIKKINKVEASEEETESIAPPNTVPLNVLTGNMEALRKHLAEREEKEKTLREKEEAHVKEIIEKIIEQGSK